MYVIYVSVVDPLTADDLRRVMHVYSYGARQRPVISLAEG